MKFHLDVTPGLNVQLAMIYLDARKQRIGHVVRPANRNHEAEIPDGTAWVRLGLRVYAAGSGRINALLFGHRSLAPADIVGRARHLLLVNHYPDYDDLYRNAFVHRRVAAYRQRGRRVDVFRLRPDEVVSYHEFENADVVTGSQESLHKLLAGSRYEGVLVHFLNEAMWEVLRHYLDRLKVVVWVHGAEIQPWHRRDFNHQTEAERDAARGRSEERMAFWRGLLKDMHPNLKLIFVSRHFAEEVMEDLGFELPRDRYEIIHNPIDTDLFDYREKPVEQRRKILSIRPYTSRTYANDLSVQAILAMADKPYFEDLEFRLIGDGMLFEETLQPLRQFRNVHIERRFLPQAEIAELHKHYGVFLCPTRMDTQGVSRDEAMASGLVPVTSRVAAVPEFVDETCAMLTDAEDAVGLARALGDLYEQPDLFLRLSANAARRVREQSGLDRTIARELAAWG